MTDKKFRIFVGGISKDLSGSIDELQKRMEKYGRILSDFEVHSNEVQDKFYAFITLESTAGKIASLQKVLNGVNFKGSKLVIDLAKPDWQERWEKDSRRQDMKITQRKVRQKITDSRLERISQANENPFKLALVSKGRMRESKRKDLKNMTIRVEIRGRVRIIKCKKTKLWGIAKNRGIKDLTCRFIAGEWRDGAEHVIDRLTKKVLIFDNDGIKVQDYEPAEAVAEELVEEHGKTNKVLEGLLSKYNFDKPIEFEEDEEPTAGSDYEFNKNSDNEDEEEEVVDIKYEIPEKDCVKPSQETIVREYFEEHPELLHQSGLPAPHGESDDEDDDEFYKTLRIKYSGEEQEEQEEQDESQPNLEQEQEQVADDDHDDEFIPSFTSSSNAPVVEAAEEEEQADSDDEFIPSFGQAETSSNANTTEALRSLLNPIDGKPHRTEEIETFSQMEDIPIPEFQHKKSLGLFFSHFESPFLVAQSQINKFANVDINDDGWDKWFWDNRGELNREFRRRRRDTLKKNRKGQGKVSII